MSLYQYYHNSILLCQSPAFLIHWILDFHHLQPSMTFCRVLYNSRQLHNIPLGSKSFHVILQGSSVPEGIFHHVLQNSIPVYGPIEVPFLAQGHQWDVPQGSMVSHRIPWCPWVSMTLTFWDVPHGCTRMPQQWMIMRHTVWHSLWRCDWLRHLVWQLMW
jgi:hypothetical protein